MQDFEPYFCTWEGCPAPFNVPNTFGGLLSHMQSHVQLRYHIDMPDGEHMELDEAGLKEHIKQCANDSDNILATMKKASQRRAAFVFESCDFCGGFPDELEKRFKDRDTLECQVELRRHVKKHMQDVALFLPPYREDIIDDDEDLKSSAIDTERSSRQSQSTVKDLSDQICTNEKCDCKLPGKYEELPTSDASMDGNPTAENMWAYMFPKIDRYDTSPVPDSYYLREKNLAQFVVRWQAEQPRAAAKKGMLGQNYGTINAEFHLPAGKIGAARTAGYPADDLRTTRNTTDTVRDHPLLPRSRFRQPWRYSRPDRQAMLQAGWSRSPRRPRRSRQVAAGHRIHPPDRHGAA